MAYFSGKNAVLQVGMSSLTMDQYDMSTDSEAVDVSNFTSAGDQENVAGFRRIEVSMSGPYSAAIGIAIGATGTITVSGSTSGAGTFSIAVPVRITQVKATADAKGRLSLSVQAVSNGVLPTLTGFAV